MASLVLIQKLKVCLSLNFLIKNFPQEYINKDIRFKGDKYHFIAYDWDAGHFRILMDILYINVFIFVYDITDKHSFEKLQKAIKILVKYWTESQFILCGKNLD